MFNLIKTKLAIGLLLMAVVCGLLYWQQSLKKNAPKTPEQKSAQAPAQSFVTPQFKEIKSFVGTEVPDYFPAELVPSGTVNIIKNEERQGENQLSYLLVYESKKSFTENTGFFKSYLTKNKWKMGPGLEEGTGSIISATKNNDSLTVSVYQAKATDPVVINIVYLKNK